MTKKADASQKKSSKKDTTAQAEQYVAELTADLQRLRADFENYRKRTEQEKEQARRSGGDVMILKLLPVIDTIDRAIAHVPDTLADDNWVKGIVAAQKNLEKTLQSLEIEKIEATAGALFNPELHEAIQFDEDSTGDTEVIESELQAGYTRAGVPIRHAMVRVTRQ